MYEPHHAAKIRNTLEQWLSGDIVSNLFTFLIDNIDIHRCIFSVTTVQ
jgi:hypothetical protein